MQQPMTIASLCFLLTAVSVQASFIDKMVKVELNGGSTKIDATRHKFELCHGKAEHKNQKSGQASFAGIKQSSNTTRMSLHCSGQLVIERETLNTVTPTCCTASSLACAGCMQLSGNNCAECSGGYQLVTIGSVQGCLMCEDTPGWKDVTDSFCADVTCSDKKKQRAFP
jgi:hypothetical protein